jgi:cytochrome c biogenesis protein CcdA
VLLLLALVVSIAAVDSINPSTVLPALLYALGPNGRRDVALFAAGVFSVSTAGGLVLVFGPGREILRAISTPSKHTVRLVEAGAGVLLLIVAIVLWLSRDRIARRLAKQTLDRGRSAFLLGAGIMAAELPTAVPYFGALIAITEGEKHALASVGLVVVYNLVFVAPLILIWAIIAFSGPRGAAFAAHLRTRLIVRAPVLTPILFALIGIGLLIAAAF